MSHSTGTIVTLDPDIRAMLGNVSSVATINLEIDKLGRLEEVVECGNLDVIDCLYEPPVMDYGDEFFDCMENFMSGNAAECNRLANKIFSYELQTKGGAAPSIIRESERNVEYVMFNEPDSVLSSAIKEYSNCFSLLFPSKGTISRVGRSSMRNRCQYVYLNSKMEAKFLDNYKRVCDDVGLKYIIVDNNYVFDPDLLYYCSFNYSNVIACGIHHYVCSEPNFYQAVFNEICTALCYNDYGYNMTYSRDGLNRSITQLYYDPNRCIIGSDSLYQMYKGSKRIVGGIMHDIYSDKVYSKFKVKIPYGSTPISNTYCLVGDYYHRGHTIYARDGSIIYENDGRNASVKALSNEWKIADPAGKFLQAATYLIGVYNSVAIFLGKKLFFKKDEKGKYNINDIRMSACTCLDAYDIALMKSPSGRIIINDVAYASIPAIPFSPQLMMFFGSTNYSYGTYHTVIRDNTYVAEHFDIVENESKMEYDFIRSDDDDDEERKVREKEPVVITPTSDSNKVPSVQRRRIPPKNRLNVNPIPASNNTPIPTIIRNKVTRKPPDKCGIKTGVSSIIQAGTQTDIKTLKLRIPVKKGRVNPKASASKSNINNVVPAPDFLVEALDKIGDEKTERRLWGKDSQIVRVIDKNK